MRYIKYIKYIANKFHSGLKVLLKTQNVENFKREHEMFKLTYMINNI